MDLELVVAPAGDGADARCGPAPAETGVVVAVEAPRGTRFGDVRREVAAAAGCDGESFWCGDRWLTDDDVLGLPPLLHGATLRSRNGGPSLGDCPATGSPGSVVLAVRSGLVCGDLQVLPPGEHHVGRAAGADIVVDDAEVSRLHATVVVGPPGATPVVRDLGSTNGTAVGGEPVGLEGRPVAPGTDVRLGASTLTLEPVPVVPEGERASCRADGSGRLLLNRPPRPVSAPPGATVVWPDEPVGRARTRLNLLAVVIPIAGAVVLAAITRTPGFLVVAALSPLMLIGSWAGDLVSGRRSAGEARREHVRALEAARAEIAAAVHAEESWWRETCPDLAALLWSVVVPRPDVWCRRPGRPDFLLCRFGLGDRRAAVAVTGPGRPPPDPPRLSRVPVTAALTEVGVLGIAGARSTLLATVRALVAQVAGWHSPVDVGLVVLSPAGGDWDWTRWLPHVSRHKPGDSLTSLLSELDRRSAARRSGARDKEPVVVVVMDGAESLRRLPGTSRLLTEGPAVGLVSICCDGDLVALPAECAVTVELGAGPGPQSRLVERDGTTTNFLAEGVDAAWVRQFAGALAPLRDSSGAGNEPGGVRLLDLYGAGARDPDAVVAGWRRHPAGTRIPLGVGAGGRPVRVDLARDGPHVLVAGTTGSGKSELLQTLVCALALANRPDRLSFVLVDYKGGAAFRDAARLPHTAGLVTDLDGRLSARALRSMEAEVRRRERALRDAGCTDFATYEATSVDLLPRLVIVVDEFAALVEDLPDFVGGLVAIAARGRSLGVHLVLATQRPAGVVSADIKANTNLRVALRVLDPADSVDVVDCRDAATIPARSAGRAVLRRGHDPVVHLQVARVSGTAPGAAPSARVRLVTAGSSPLRDVQPADGHGADPGDGQGSGPAGEEPTDQGRLVDAIRAAAEEIGAAPSTTPWLPPLPVIVEADQLPAATGGDMAPGEVALGLVDVPDEQRRSALTLGLDGGHHLLVVGGPGSGRTSALRLAAGQLAARHPPEALHIHALDPSGGLAGLTALPHCGTVAGRDDPSRAARLLELLVAELDCRQRRRPVRARPECDGAGTVGTDPWVLLLVDDWEALAGEFEDLDHGRASGLLDRVVREGGSVGFRVVAAGGRGALTARAASSIAERVVLRLSDPTDYALAGITPRDAPTAMPPGRGLVLPGGLEVQLARPGPRLSGGADLTDGTSPVDRRGPLRLRALPSRARLDEALVEGKTAVDGAGWILVGIGGDVAGAVGVDLATAGPAMLVAGPVGSGRSTALVAMARWLVQEGRPVALVAHPRSPLHALAAEHGACVLVPVDDDRKLREMTATREGPTVLVDDVEAIADTAVERALQELVRPGAMAAASVVVSGTTSELAATYRGLAVDVRRSRTGLLLGPPAPADGDLLGVRLPQAMTTPGPPGRGVLVVRGRPLLVQVPLDAE